MSQLVQVTIIYYELGKSFFKKYCYISPGNEFNIYEKNMALILQNYPIPSMWTFHKWPASPQVYLPINKLNLPFPSFLSGRRVHQTGSDIYASILIAWLAIWWPYVDLSCCVYCLMPRKICFMNFLFCLHFIAVPSYAQVYVILIPFCTSNSFVLNCYLAIIISSWCDWILVTCRLRIREMINLNVEYLINRHQICLIKFKLTSNV